MNALVMYDHQTDSLWSHFTGDVVLGDYFGTRLELVPSTHTTWGRWKELHPDTVALDKGGRYSYDNYTSYYRNSEPRRNRGEQRVDDRLRTKDLVVGVVIGGEAKAYAFNDLAEQPVVNDSVGGRSVLIAFDDESSTGNTFSRDVDGRTLDFRFSESAGDDGLLMVDNETGSEWRLLTGEAVSGPLMGTQPGADPNQLLFLVRLEGLASGHRPLHPGRSRLLAAELASSAHFGHHL